MGRRRSNTVPRFLGFLTLIGGAVVAFVGAVWLYLTAIWAPGCREYDSWGQCVTNSPANDYALTATVMLFVSFVFVAVSMVVSMNWSWNLIPERPVREPRLGRATRKELREKKEQLLLNKKLDDMERELGMGKYAE